MRVLTEIRDRAERYPRLVATDADTDTSVDACADSEGLPPVDLVVLYIGGNDWWSLDKKGDAAFINGYACFLRMLRERRPGVPVIVLLCDEFSGSCMGSAQEMRKFHADMARCLGAAVAQCGAEEAQFYLRRVTP